jgi:hypothetical protein
LIERLGKLFGVAWALVVVLAYGNTHPLVFPDQFTLFPGLEFFSPAVPALFALAMAGFCGYGWLVFCGASPHSFLTLGTSLSVGLLLWGLWGLMLGRFLGFSVFSFSLLALGLAAPLPFSLRQFPWQKLRAFFSIQHRKGWVIASVICLVSLGYLNSLQIVKPVTGYDDQTYHLTVPRAFFSQNSIGDLPFLPVSYRPLHMHVIYSWLLLLGNEQTIRFFIFFIGISIPLLLLLYLSHRFCSATGFIIALSFYAQPIITMVSNSGMTDIPILFVLTQTFLILCEIRLNPTSTGWARESIIGIMTVTALGMGIKTNGLFFPLGILLVWFFWKFEDLASEKEEKPAFVIPSRALAALLVGAGIGTLWYVRNYVYTGNPIFPHLPWLWNFKEILHIEVYKSIFGGYPEALYDQSMLLDRFGLGREWHHYLLLPWNVTIHGHVHDTVWSLQYFDGEIGIMALICLPIVLFSWLSSGVTMAQRFFLYSLFGAFGLWALGSQQIRFLLPVISGFLFFLAGWLPLRNWTKKLLVLAVVGSVVFSINFTLQRIARGNDFVQGKQTKEQYLQEWLPFYKAFRFLNALPQRGVVLPLFEERVFYLSQPFYWMDLVPHYFISVCLNASDARQIRTFLEQCGISYVYIPKHGVSSLLQIFEDPVYKKRVTEFFQKQVTLVYQDDQSMVFSLPRPQ